MNSKIIFCASFTSSFNSGDTSLSIESITLILFEGDFISVFSKLFLIYSLSIEIKKFVFSSSDGNSDNFCFIPSYSFANPTKISIISFLSKSCTSSPIFPIFFRNAIYVFSSLSIEYGNAI